MKVSVVNDCIQQFLAYTTRTFFDRRWAAESKLERRSAACWIPTSELAGMLYKRHLNCQSPTKWHIVELRWRMCEISPRFLHLCNLQRYDPKVQSLQPTFLHVWITEVTQMSAFYSWHCHLKPFWYFQRVSDAVSPSMKQILKRMRRSFKSAVGKSRIAINTHKYKHPLRNNTEGYGCRTP